MSDRSDLLELEEVSSRVYPDLERAPGKKDNWVERSGGLPSYIERIAKHLHYEQGYTISRSIASAVSTVKRWCAGGSVTKTGPSKSNVKPATKAKACKAVAQWEALKAKNKAKNIKEARQIRLDYEYLDTHALIDGDDRQALLESFNRRLLAVEGMEVTLAATTTRGRANVVQGALDLLESADWTPPQLAQMGWGVADPREQARAAAALAGEADELRCMIDALGGDLREATEKDEVAKAEKRIDQSRGDTQNARLNDSTVTLTRGSQGGLVEKAQARLQALGYGLEPDGDFGRKTDVAVRDFQVDHGLKRDGELGPRTRWAMRGTTPEEAQTNAEQRQVTPAGDTEPESPEVEEEAGGEEEEEKAPEAPWLAKGMGWGGEPNADVQTAQEALIGLGTHVGDAGADGKFGPETEKGVKRIQRRYGLKADGMVGPKTHDVLSSGGNLEEAWSVTTSAGTTTQAHARKLRAKEQRKAARTSTTSSGGGNSNYDESKHKRAPAGSPGGGRFISKGGSGAAVRSVQRSLGVKNVSGNFDKGTERAVRQFQRDNGLQVDGVIGAQTAAALLGEQAQDPGELQDGQVQALRKQRDLQEATLRGAARKAIRSIKRLPDGTFAPSGRGSVLKPGDDVKGGGIRGRVKADGRTIQTSDGAEVPLSPEASSDGQESPGFGINSSDVGKVTVKDGVAQGEAKPELVQDSLRKARRAMSANPEAKNKKIREILGKVAEMRPLTEAEKGQMKRAGGTAPDGQASPGDSAPSSRAGDDGAKAAERQLRSAIKEAKRLRRLKDRFDSDQTKRNEQGRSSFSKDGARKKAHTNYDRALAKLRDATDAAHEAGLEGADLEGGAGEVFSDAYDKRGISRPGQASPSPDGQASPGDDQAKRWKNVIASTRKDVAGQDDELDVADDIAADLADDYAQRESAEQDTDEIGSLIDEVDEWRKSLDPEATPTLEGEAYQERRDYYGEHGQHGEQDWDGQASPGDGQNSPGLSPARSGVGNLRNFKAMGDVKIAKLREEMQDYVGEDPDAVEAINAELDKRGIDPIEGTGDGLIDSSTKGSGGAFSELPDGTVFKQGPATLEKTGPTTAKALKDDSGKLTLGTNYSVNPGHTPDEILDNKETKDPEAPATPDATPGAPDTPSQEPDAEEEEGDTTPAAASEAAEGLGAGWSPENVLAALDQLAGKGINLDPEVESAETLMAVIKAAQITPGGIDKPTTGVV